MPSHTDGRSIHRDSRSPSRSGVEGRRTDRGFAGTARLQQRASQSAVYLPCAAGHVATSATVASNPSYQARDLQRGRSIGGSTAGNPWKDRVAQIRERISSLGRRSPAPAPPSQKRPLRGSQSRSPRRQGGGCGKVIAAEAVSRGDAGLKLQSSRDIFLSPHRRRTERSRSRDPPLSAPATRAVSDSLAYRASTSPAPLQHSSSACVKKTSVAPPVSHRQRFGNASPGSRRNAPSPPRSSTRYGVRDDPNVSRQPSPVADRTSSNLVAPASVSRRGDSSTRCFSSPPPARKSSPALLTEKDRDDRNWLVAYTPKGSKFRYTPEGDTELIAEAPPQWERKELANGRQYWQKIGTSEISFADPTKPGAGESAHPRPRREVSGETTPASKALDRSMDNDIQRQRGISNTAVCVSPRGASSLSRGHRVQHEKLLLRNLCVSSVGDLKQYITEFFGIVSRKGLSSRWNAGYNVTFARHVPTEQDFHRSLISMGITICDDDADDKIPPYCTPTASNPSVPGFRAFYGGGARAKITFEFNSAEKEVVAKGSRNVVMNQHTVLAAFLGRVKDITAQQAPPKAQTVERQSVDESACAKVITRYLNSRR